MATIMSRQHALVKEYRRIARGDARLALLDGWHLLQEAVNARLIIDSVAVVPGAVSHSDEQLLVRARDLGATIYPVSTSVLDALSPVRTPAGVVAAIQRRHATISDLLPTSPPLIVVAVDMQDPGNVGALVRSAEAGGATGVAFAGRCADAWGWKALRSAMGSTFRLPVATVEDAAGLTHQLQSARVAVLATVPRGGTPMHVTDMRNATAILIGGEGPGLPPAVIERADQRVSIPMQSPVESLNAAVAAALLVFEARRQREVRS